MWNLVGITQNTTGYLNRKAAIIAPNALESGPQNICKLRYADILLMKAEAAAQLSKPAEVVAVVSQVRQHARLLTRPLGTTPGSLSYEPTNASIGTLPAISAGLLGSALLNAIWHERRVEFAEKSLRCWTEFARAAT